MDFRYALYVSIICNQNKTIAMHQCNDMLPTDHVNSYCISYWGS